MSNVFAGSEIVEIGIEIEKNGRDFYEELAAKTKDRKAKDMFVYLAEQERLHIDTFKVILDAVHKYEPPESYPGEYFAYMKALADEHIFTKRGKGREIAKGATNDRKAVELGITFEKESILFYQGMKKVVPEGQVGPVDELIAQENSHLFKLYSVKESMK